MKFIFLVVEEIKKNDTKHCRFNNNDGCWYEVSTLPYSFEGGHAIVYDDEIHIIGSENSSYYNCHYKYKSLHVINNIKIDNLEEIPIVSINDNKFSTTSTYSSNKIESMITNTNSKITNLENSMPIIQSGTSDLTAGVSELSSGTIYCVYE